jgi:hypothetical protein
MSSSAASDHLAMANPPTAGATPSQVDAAATTPADPARAETPPAPTSAGKPAEPASPQKSTAILRAVTFLAGAVTLSWVVAAILAAGHGFDTTDEGFYLLSYRWWSVNGRTFTGLQYLYGPVFQALGYDIAGLRLFRLATVVFTLVVFGWAFMGWLRTRRPNAPPSRWWEAAGTAAILASGGAVYGWLPLSPGYNDVSLLGALLTAAVVLHTAAATERGRDVPAWVPVAAGPIAFAMLLCKWASSMVVVFVAAIVIIVVLRRRGWRRILRFIGWVLAGAVACAAVVHVAVVPLTSLLPEMMAINKIVAAKTNSPSSLLTMYWRTSLAVVTSAARTHVVLLIALLVAVVARGRWAQRLALVLGAAGLALSAWRVGHTGGLSGGTLNLRRYPATLMLVVLSIVVVAVAVVVLERRRGSSLATAAPRDWLLFGMLLALPYLQALGTGNAVHFMAVNGFAAWTAVAIAVITGMEGATATARRLTALVTAGCVVAAACVGIGGLLVHPYRTKGYAQTTAQVRDVGPLSSIRLDPQTAAKYTALHDRLAPYLKPGRAIMGFDEMAGVVLLLDGRSVGEAWYSASDRQRTAAGIAAACRNGPWWGSQKPLLLFRRPVSAVDRDALRSCGLDLETGYTLLAPAHETMDLSVYVPIEEE